MSPYASYLLETLATLLAVCAMAALFLLGARKLGVGRASGSLELLGRLPLDARRSIVLVKVGETVFVVGVGDGGMTKLGELSAASVPREVAQEPKSFAAVLARAVGRDRADKPAGPAAEAKKEDG
jgi:flagellar biogenesis protein FliO